MKRERIISSYDESVLNELRTRFFDKNSSNLSDFESSDLIKLKDHYWFATRFLHDYNGDIYQALFALTSTLKWRKEMKFANFSSNYFPDLFPKIGAIFFYEKDKKGFPTMYVRAKLLRKMVEMKPYYKLYSSLMLWKIDELVGDHGWTLIIDCKNTGVSQLDFELSKYFIQTMVKHFPCSLEKIIIVDMPWVLRAFWNLIKSWLSNEKINMIVFTSRSNLDKYIDKDKLPDFLDGTCTRPYKGAKMVPESSPEIVEFGVKVVGLTEKRCHEIYSFYDDLFADID